MGYLTLCSERKKGFTEPVEFDVYHCGKEGTYKVDLTLNGQSFQCILDTCSPYLLVSGETCNTCEQEQGLFDVAAQQKKGSKSLGVHTKINFFSQYNEVEWWSSQLQFDKKLSLNKQNQQLKLNFGVITANVSHEVNGGVLPGRNVLGIGVAEKNLDLSSTNGNRKTFIAQLFSDGGFEHAVYAIKMDPDGMRGKFSIGKMVPDLHWAPLARAEHLNYLESSAQWVLPVKSAILVDTHGESLAVLPLDWARLDTGNTWLSMPASWADEVEAAANKPQNNAKAIVMTFGFKVKGAPPGVSWSFPINDWAGPIELANKTGFGGLAHDASLDSYPHNGDTCVIGNETFKGITLCMDYEKGNLGFGGPNISKEA